jgi:hypothetical protein
MTTYSTPPTRWKTPFLIKALLFIQKGMLLLQKQELEQRLAHAQTQLKTHLREYDKNGELAKSEHAQAVAKRVAKNNPRHSNRK